MSKENKEMRHGLTVRVLVIGIAMCLLLALFGSYTGTFGQASSRYGSSLGAIYDNGDVAPTFAALAVTMFVISLVAPRFLKTEIACLTTMLLIAGAFTLMFVNTIPMMINSMGRWVTTKPTTMLMRVLSDMYQNPLLYPTGVQSIRLVGGKVAESILYKPWVYDGWFVAGASVPSEWYPAIAFNILYFGSACLFFIFAGALMSREFIDNEGLAFPLGQAEVAILNSTGPKAAVTKIVGRKFFWIGALLGTIFYGYSAYMAVIAYPQTTTSVPGTGVIGNGVWDFTPMNTVLPFVPLVVTFNPLYTSFSYLMPMDVLLSAIVAGIILCFVLAPSLYGFYPVTWTAGRVFHQATDYLRTGGSLLPTYQPTWDSPPKDVQDWFAVGMFFGMVLWTIWLAKPWRWLSVDKEYRSRDTLVNFTGAVVFLVIWMACYAILGAPPIAVILMIAFTAIWNLGAARWRAETGGFLGGLSTQRFGLSMYQYGWMVSGIYEPLGVWSRTTGVAPGYEYAVYNSGQFAPGYFGRAGYFQNSNPIGATLESFYIARVTGTEKAEVFRSVMIAFLFTVVPMTIISVWLPYYVDMSKIPAKYFAALDDARWCATTTPVTIGYTTWGVPTNDTLQWLVYWKSGAVFIAGIAAALLLYLLRGRHPKLFLRPEGILMGLISFASPYLDSYLLAYALKYLTLRIGGAKIYEEKGIPLVSGLMVGVGLTAIAAAIGNLLVVFKMI